MSALPDSVLEELDSRTPPRRWCVWCDQLAIARCDHVVERIGGIVVRCSQPMCAKHRTTAHHTVTTGAAGGARFDTADRCPVHAAEEGGDL